MKNSRRSLARPLLSALLFALLFVVAGPGPVDAQNLRPGTRLRVIETEKFDILFPEESGPSARYLAGIADGIYTRISGLLGFGVPDRIPVLITPHTDEFNGYFSSAPYPHIVLFDTPLSIEWTTFDDAFAKLFTHELVHAISLSTRGPALAALHRIFGNWVMPSMLNAPAFMIEGVTVSFESLDGSGRANDPAVAEKLRQAVLEGQFMSPFEAAGAAEGPHVGNGAYEYGGLFSAWLQENYGMDQYSKLWKAMGSEIRFSFSYDDSGFYGIFRDVYGFSVEKAWADFRDSLVIQDVVKNDSPGIGGERAEITALSSGGSSIFYLESRSGEVRSVDALSGRETGRFRPDEAAYDIDVSADGKRLLVSGYRYKGELATAMISEYDAGGKRTGATWKGLRSARYFRDGVVGIGSKLHANTIVFMNRKGESRILATGTTNVLYSAPAPIDGNRIFLLRAERGVRKPGILDADSGVWTPLATGLPDDEARWKYARDLRASGGVVRFSFCHDGRMYKPAQLLVRPDSSLAVRFGLIDYSGGIHDQAWPAAAGRGTGPDHAGSGAAPGGTTPSGAVLGTPGDATPAAATPGTQGMGGTPAPWYIASFAAGDALKRLPAYRPGDWLEAELYPAGRPDATATGAAPQAPLGAAHVEPGAAEPNAAPPAMAALGANPEAPLEAPLGAAEANAVPPTMAPQVEAGAAITGGAAPQAPLGAAPGAPLRADHPYSPWRYLNPFKFWIPYPLLRASPGRFSVDGLGALTLLTDPADTTTVQLTSGWNFRHSHAWIGLDLTDLSAGIPVSVSLSDSVEPSSDGSTEYRVSRASLSATFSRGLGREWLKAFAAPTLVLGASAHNPDDGSGAYSWNYSPPFSLAALSLGLSSLRTYPWSLVGSGTSFTLSSTAISVLGPVPADAPIPSFPSVAARTGLNAWTARESPLPWRLGFYAATDSSGCAVDGSSTIPGSGLSTPMAPREYLRSTPGDLPWVAGGAAELFLLDVPSGRNISHLYANRFFASFGARAAIYDSAATSGSLPEGLSRWSGRPLSGILSPGNSLMLADSVYARIGAVISFHPVLATITRLRPHVLAALRLADIPVRGFADSVHVEFGLSTDW